ncbi:MAG TPA: histidine phosphatase family protein [Polyangiaceae bacterium]|nr:histidine phosphatase family protein [Polyangiaceae bacterium]
MPFSGPCARLFLVRHGETDDNHSGVYQGQSGRGINARGRVQAEKLALRLAELEPGVDLHALYSSDLERAVDTASVLSQVLGLEVRVDEGLREVYVGAWQGKTAREVEALYPEEHAAWRAGLDVARGGGETYAELAARMSEALDRAMLAASLAAQAAAGPSARCHVMVVSHGAAIKAYVAGVLGPRESIAETMRRLGPLANTAVTVLEREPGGATRLVSWNDVAHLRDAVLTTAKTAAAPPPARSSRRQLP